VRNLGLGRGEPNYRGGVLKLLLVLIILAVVTYALVRVIQRRGVQPPLKGPLAGIRSTRPSGSRTARPSGPLGPDDDEEFLRDLDRKRLNGDGPDS
jgi:hypothetical protein